MKNTHNHHEQNSESPDQITGTTHQLPPKIRVHSLAKLLGTSSKDILKFLGKQGIARKSAHSNIDRENAEIIRNHIHNTNFHQTASEPNISVKQSHQHNYQNFFLAPQPVPVQHDKTEKNETQQPPQYGDTISTDKKKTRRGRRGRGRGKGEFILPHEIKDDSASGEFLVHVDELKINSLSAKKPTSSQTTPSPQTTTPTVRRTRKRKKTNPETTTVSNSNLLGDDIADTIIEHTEEDGSTVVVHERAQRRSRPTRNDRPTGVQGSTRMAAKRQRRRELRAPKTRISLIQDEEFLARRKTIERVMVVREKQNSAQENYTQVGVLEDGVLVEHFVTTDASSSMVGNIYLGEIQNVLPSMEAAFVNIGQGRNAVLYAGEVDWESAGLSRKNRRIEEVLTTGNQVLVQVTKDPVGQKGARLTTQISIAGRYLVFVPGGNSIGISRRLHEGERRRLKSLLSDILPADCGVIVRTAAEGVSTEDFIADLERLRKQWEEIENEVKKAQEAKNPRVKTLYEEPDFLVKVVRDLFNEDFSKLIIDGDGPWKIVENYISTVASDLMEKVERFVSDPENPVDFFGQYKIEEQLSKALDRKVWLPSGGTLIIERTEAMTVIDVNTGKYVGEGGNLEETVTRNNLEAAEEIVRQLRLRDIGGMIIVDFIDMIMQTNQDLVLATLEKELSLDRTRHQISEITSLGLVQITRKKIGTGLLEAFSTPCDHCHGLGLIIHSDPVEELPQEELESHRHHKRNHKRNDKFSHDDNKNFHSKGSQAHHRNNHANSPTRTEHPLFKVLAKSTHPDLPEHALTENSTEPELFIPEVSIAVAESDNSTANSFAKHSDPQSIARETKKNKTRRRASRPMQAPTTNSSGKGDDTVQDAENSELKGNVTTEQVITSENTSELSTAPAILDENLSHPEEHLKSPTSSLVINEIGSPLISVESTPRKKTTKKTQSRSRSGNKADELKSSDKKRQNSVEKSSANLSTAVEVTAPELATIPGEILVENTPLVQTRSRRRAANRPADVTKNS